MAVLAQLSCIGKLFIGCITILRTRGWVIERYWEIAWTRVIRDSAIMQVMAYSALDTLPICLCNSCTWGKTDIVVRRWFAFSTGLLVVAWHMQWSCVWTVKPAFGCFIDLTFNTCGCIIFMAGKGTCVVWEHAYTCTAIRPDRHPWDVIVIEVVFNRQIMVVYVSRSGRIENLSRICKVTLCTIRWTTMSFKETADILFMAGPACVALVHYKAICPTCMIIDW